MIARMLAATGMVAVLGMTAGATQAQVKLDAAQAAAAFGARDRVIDASLSPDGTKVAFVTPGPQQSTVIQVLDVATGALKPVNLADGKPFATTGCNWASSQRMVCTMYGVTNYAAGSFLPYQRLIALDADGGNAVPLGARQKSQYRAQLTDGYVVDWRDGKTDSVLLARTYVPERADGMRGGGGAAVYGLAVDLLDTRTGKVDHLESPDPRGMAYRGDGQGVVRIMGRDPSPMQNEYMGKIEWRYRKAGSRDWLPFSLYDSVTEQGLYPLAVDSRADTAYALMKENGRDALFRVALDGSMKRELAYAHPEVDVGGIVRVGRAGRVVAARYTTDKPQVSFFDPAYEKLVTGLSKALPRLPLISVVDSSADETVHLIHAASDTDPGRYYLYNQAKKSLAPLAQDRPELSGVPLAKVQPITYKAADGTAIPAYLTMPPGGAVKGLPAIVMPHGGPASRDEWGFDWLAQFFANRGYAVIQPNYRGSSGYGQEWFQQNGFRSWKTAIGDVDDAGRWMVAEGIADPAKLAIVGWSYGGYAALQSQVVEPDLFKAVIAIAPVTDLGMLRDEAKGFTDMTVQRNYIGDGVHLEEGSPARHAAKFKSPVMMFHGTKDINVGVAQARAMDKKLRGAGKKSELIVYPDIDHQLRDTTVRTDMLAKAEAFLAKALN